jgi:hypothetical protein
MHDVESDYSKRREMEDHLWLEALNKARERAEATLKAINMKIDSVFAVSPEAFTQIQEKILGPETDGGCDISPRADQTGPNRSRHLFNLACEVAMTEGNV